MYSYIQNIANNVIENFETINPLDIVTSLKRVEFATYPLTDNINGFYKYISPNKQMIIVNENLCDEDFNFTLFHELAHYFLGHKDTLLLNSSFTMNLKEEYHADLFATCMYLRYSSKNNFDNNSYPKRVYELMNNFI